MLAHSHLQRVWGLLEGDVLARGAAGYAVGGGVDHLRAGERDQQSECRAGEHVAAGDRAVLEDAEQVDGAPLVHASSGGTKRRSKLPIRARITAKGRNIHRNMQRLRRLITTSVARGQLAKRLNNISQDWHSRQTRGHAGRVAGA